ncbi:MAG: hypothetical protein E7313_01520 [Clostridiales bacterium]|nr:hypothetical protein [Clostridiales bacterium]
MSKITYELDYTYSVPEYLFQGTEAELQKELRTEKVYVIRGWSGSYILGRNSSGIIEEHVDGKLTRRINPKDFLYDFYKVKRVTHKTFEKLCNDLEKGLVSFDKLYKKYAV